MVKSPQSNTSTDGVRKVNGVAVRPLSITDVFVEALQGWSAKLVASRLRKLVPVSARTVESWKQAKRTPHARHVVALLSDDELCKALLAAAGRGDLARHQETISALKAALVSEGK